MASKRSMFPIGKNDILNGRCGSRMRGRTASACPEAVERHVIVERASASRGQIPAACARGVRPDRSGR